MATKTLHDDERDSFVFGSPKKVLYENKDFSIFCSLEGGVILVRSNSTAAALTLHVGQGGSLVVSPRDSEVLLEPGEGGIEVVASTCVNREAKG